MATYNSSYMAALANAKAGQPSFASNQNDVYGGARPGEIDVTLDASVAVNDVIPLCPVQPGTKIKPELSHVRLSNGNASLTVKLQHVSAGGTVTDLSATRTLTNAAVAFAPAAATKLPLLNDGTLRLLVTVVTTAAAVVLTVEPFEIRKSGA